MKKVRKGFTLIELLIVIVIIGILSVAFLPTVLSAPKKARDATRKAEINAIVQGLQTYYSQKELPTGAINSVNDLPADFAKTFPNNNLPSDPGDGNKAFQFKYDNDKKCFIVMTPVKMEIVENGNTNAKEPNELDCTTKLPGNKDKTAVATNKDTYFAAIVSMDL